MRLAAALSACVAIAGCDEGRVRPPTTSVTVVNAAPTLSDIRFYRGAGQAVRLLPSATLSYLGGDRLTFESDTYNYVVRSAPAGALEREVASLTHTPGPDTHSVYVVVETAGTPEVLVFEQPVFPPGSDSTEFSIVHGAETAGTAAVYVEAPGTDLLTATPRATLDFRVGSPPISAAPGGYVVTITEPGAAANVLFTSPGLAFAAGQTYVLVIGSGAGTGTSALALSVTAEGSQPFGDVNAGSAVRAFNGAGDRGARDVFVNGDFAAPFIAATAFGAASTFSATPAGAATLAITPAGNPSAIEHETTQSLDSGSMYTLVIAGNSGDIGALVGFDVRRATRDEARLQVINAVNHYDSLYVYIAPVGTDTATILPSYQVASPGITAREPVPLGDLELTLRDPATGTFVFGPQTISMPTSGIYTIAAVDNPDGTTADIVLLDDFQ